MTRAEATFARAVSRMTYSNPFLPERLEAEREVLGSAYVDPGPVWSLGNEAPDLERPNLARLRERIEGLASTLREKLSKGAATSEEEWDLYEDLVLYLLYDRNRAALGELIERPGRPPERVAAYPVYRTDYLRYLALPGRPEPKPGDLAHVFACFFQIRRAFQVIYAHIIGSSMSAARLRGEVWRSIFTHDIRRYRRTLHARMGEIATLITGPSGSGKELVARAIGLSRYLAFDPSAERFTGDLRGSFIAVNLSALSPSLIESELFGHRRGSFTGALEDRPGWLESCPPHGTVFLDEIGDLDGPIQVKLLRTLQTREFHRIGETRPRAFEGKLIAATHRDLAREMRDGRFRPDFYYRLCSDLIATRPLREQLNEAPGDLYTLLLFVARRVAGDEAEALAREAEAWIDRRLGRDYAWPGNFRELEQCVRNVMIRREYHPTAATGGSPVDELTEAVAEGRLTADALLRRYATLVYARTGNYQETARRLLVDRRTVQARLDREFLERLRAAERPTREPP
jgi:transcriptional regulator with AAA-type ATPase domain